LLFINLYSKNSPVIDFIQEIQLFPVQKQREKEPTKVIAIPLSVKVKEIKELIKEAKPPEPASPADNYIMPPQPEGYIKPPRHDFF
jgi:hypothetical protein